MDRENIMERYNSIKELVINRKDEFREQMGFLENQTDWLKSPASAKYHLCQ